jgi:CBS domain-containing protein
VHAEVEVRVRDLLERKPAKLITVELGRNVDAAITLMMEHDVGGLPVTAADGKLVGFISERDIVRAVRLHGGTFYELRIAYVMRPAATCEADDSMETVMRRMTLERLRHLIVRDNGTIAGVISVGDLVKYRLEQLETEAGVLRDYVAAQRAR